MGVGELEREAFVEDKYSVSYFEYDKIV